MVTVIPAGSRGVVWWTGLTEIQVQWRSGADRWVGFRIRVVEVAGWRGVEEDLRPLVFGAMVERWSRGVNGDGGWRGL